MSSELSLRDTRQEQGSQLGEWLVIGLCGGSAAAATAISVYLLVAIRFGVIGGAAILSWLDAAFIL